MCSSHKGKKPPSSQDIDLCVLISLGKAICAGYISRIGIYLQIQIMFSSNMCSVSFATHGQLLRVYHIRVLFQGNSVHKKNQGMSAISVTHG